MKGIVAGRRARWHHGTRRAQGAASSSSGGGRAAGLGLPLRVWREVRPEAPCSGSSGAFLGHQAAPAGPPGTSTVSSSLVSGQDARGTPTTMPHCFIHRSSRVRNYFWTAGADSTVDVAGWWTSPGEVKPDGRRLGWSEADVEAATFAWLEARRPAVQLLPNVPVPVVPQPLKIPTSSTRAPPSGTTLSHKELVPTEVSPHPETERHRPHLGTAAVDTRVAPG